MIEFVEEENAKGAFLRPQTTSRGVGGLFALDHRTPFDASTSWKMLKDKSFTDRLAMLEDENVRSSLCDLDVEPQLDFDISYLLFDDAVDYRHEFENSLTAHAKRMGMSPLKPLFSSIDSTKAGS